jgi:purine-cytosine permease-like protein
MDSYTIYGYGTLFILSIGAFIVWIGIIFLVAYFLPNKKKDIEDIKKQSEPNKRSKYDVSKSRKNPYRRET